MPKRLLEDIKIRQPRNDTPKVIKRNPVMEEVREPKQVKTKERNIEKRGSRRYGLWIVATISLVFLFFAFSYVFSNATVTVNPKKVAVVLNENLSANLDSNTGALSFHLMEISGEESKEVETDMQKEILKQATGVALLYNAFSSAPQLLSIDTRLEGSNGKIYKTKVKTTVPGISKDGTPGKVEVVIYAADAGEAGNSEPLDFKIFGFKGTPKYAKFYGRSQGPIHGGVQGVFPVLEDSKKISAANEMKASLKTKLLRKATDQIPAGFIMFKDAVYLDTEEVDTNIVEGKDNIVPLVLRGTLYGLLFNEEKLTKKLAQSKIEKYDGAAVYIPEIKSLIFLLPNKDIISFRDLKSINFNLSGAATIVSRVDGDRLRTDLLGKSKEDFNRLLVRYPNINSADLVISPLWRRSIPDKSKDIRVIVNYPKK